MMAASGGRQDRVLRIGARVFVAIVVCAVGLSALVGALQDERPSANKRLAAAMEMGALKMVVRVIFRRYVRRDPFAR